MKSQGNLSLGIVGAICPWEPWINAKCPGIISILIITVVYVITVGSAHVIRIIPMSQMKN